MEHQLHSGNKLSLINGKAETVDTPVTIKPAQIDNVMSRLPALLQTTLVLEELLPLFEEQLQQIMHFDSFHYQHQAMNCHIDSADQRHHRCNYTLDLNGHYLGELSLTRRHKFSDAQIELLEEVLCLLVYPLRNCLLYKQALQSALHDELTGLGNRAAYDNSLQREIELSQRQNSPLSLVVLDIDNFKKINDSYGHSTGDRALKLLAKTINQTMRRSDMAFRFGGEEFVLLLSNTDAEAATIMAERLRQAVAESVYDDGAQGSHFTVSLGVAELETEEQAYHLFERADMALYQAKQTGRNLTVCAPSVQSM
jgi:diguanylate cyclase (GGDEF)-like protein